MGCFFKSKNRVKNHFLKGLSEMYGMMLINLMLFVMEMKKKHAKLFLEGLKTIGQVNITCNKWVVKIQFSWNYMKKLKFIFFSK